MDTERLRSVTRDLNRVAPRSPYARLSDDFPTVAARVVDKCRADLLGTRGEYHYNCPLDRIFFKATGLDAGELRAFVGTGASDSEVSAWMREHATVPREKILRWSRWFRLNPILGFLVFEDWLHERRAKRQSAHAT